MPLQNRVSPWSELIVTSERGMFMGNRGCLHDAHRQIVRNVAGTRWIICQLEFKGRHRQLMTPGQYTELFFLDEATALAAGHRPCAECQRDRFTAFRDAFAEANDLTGPVRATDIDALLHGQRRASPPTLDGEFVRSLPNGVLVARDGVALLTTTNGLRRWSAAGYLDRHACPDDGSVHLLTPPATVGALRAGYTPVLHSSARDAAADSPT